MSNNDKSQDRWPAALGRLRSAVEKKHDGVVKDAAEACGINYSVFSAIHSGARLPGPKDRKRLQTGLNIPKGCWPDSGR